MIRLFVAICLLLIPGFGYYAWARSLVESGGRDPLSVTVHQSVLWNAKRGAFPSADRLAC